MRSGLAVPNLGDYGDMDVLLDVARRADAAGWAGIFLWDHVNYRNGQSIAMVEPWTALAAIAAVLGARSTMTMGVLVTPLARRRPWVLARQIAAVAQLAPGRVVCGAGLGTPADAEFEAFGEPGGDRERAVRLEESLAVLRSLLDGAMVSFAGSSIQVDGVQFPAAAARVPIWIAGRWPNRRPLRRAARHDGLYVEKQGGDALTPDDVAAIADFVGSNRQDGGPFDLVVPGRTDSGDGTLVAEYASAGATWWVEYLGPKWGPLREMLAASIVARAVSLLAMSESSAADAARLELKIVVGSTRDGRACDLFMPWLVERSSSHGAFDVEVLDLRDWPLPYFQETMATIGDMGAPTYSDPMVRAWNAKIKGGDVFVFVTPEYNHSISGVLKNAMDNVFVSQGFRNKACGSVGYSGGLVGGARAVEHIVTVACEFEMVPMRTAVLIGRVGEAFAGGQCRQPMNEATLTVMLDDLAWWGRLLRSGRSGGQLPPPTARIRAAMTAMAKANG